MSKSGKTPRATKKASKSATLVHSFGIDDYEAYWEQRSLDKPAREHKRVFEALLRMVPAPRKILEMGPGGGHLFHALEQAGYDMFAVDISQSVIDHLKSKPHRTFKADLNQDLPDFGTRFGAIVGGMVLHHIILPEEFLKKLRALLDSDGHLILIIPNIVTLKNRTRLLTGRFPKLSASHRSFMTPKEVTLLMERCGFEVLKTIAARKKILSSISPTLFSSKLIVIARLRK